MNLLIKIFVLTVFSRFVNCEPNETDILGNEANTVDFNKFYEKLEKLPKIGIKSYLEIPDPDVLLSSEGSFNKACKIYNQSIETAQMLNKWHENTILKNLNSSFMFGDMLEIINLKPVYKRTSLRRFVNGMDQYLYETNLKLNMPSFFREIINFPSVLECDYLEDKFQSVEMELILNYENFSQNRKSNFDKLVCAVKGNLTFVMMDQKNIEYLLSNQQNLTKKVLKKIDGVRVELTGGDCVYIPQVMYVFGVEYRRTYSLKAEYAWIFTISWSHVDRYVSEEECFDRENRKQTSKIVNHKFKNDHEEDLKLFSKISVINLFVKYLGSNGKQALDLNDFIAEDEKQMKVKCDQSCKNILFKVFTLLDSNKDNMFDQNDLDNFDEQSLLKLNEEIKYEMKLMDDKEKSGVENLRSMLKQLKELAANVQAGSETARMIESKTKEWYNTLSFDQRKRLKEDQLSEIVDELLNINQKRPNVELKKPKKLPENKVQDDSVEIIAEDEQNNDDERMNSKTGEQQKNDFKEQKIKVGAGNGLNLSDEQMDEIMKIIETEEAKDARNEL